MAFNGKEIKILIKGGFLEIHIPVQFIGEVLEERLNGSCGVSVTAFLTPRQRQVFCFIRKGLSRKETAAQLHVSESAVKQHANAIYKLLGLKNGKMELLAKYGYSENISEGNLTQ